MSRIRNLFDWIIRRHIMKLIGEHDHMIQAVLVGRYPLGSFGEAKLKLAIEWWEVKIEVWTALARGEESKGRS